MTGEGSETRCKVMRRGDRRGAVRGRGDRREEGVVTGDGEGNEG